MGNDVAGV